MGPKTYPKQKAPAMPGLPRTGAAMRSVHSEHSHPAAHHPGARAELVVDPDQTDVDVLLDALGRSDDTGRIDEVEVLVAQEQVVVFDADRPVRREGIFDTCADRAAPARGVVGA